MAYRRKGRSKTAKRYTLAEAKRMLGRSAPKRKYASKGRRKKSTAKKRTTRSRTITVVVQSAPVAAPTLATPQARAAPRRSRFTA